MYSFNFQLYVESKDTATMEKLIPWICKIIEKGLKSTKYLLTTEAA